MKRTLTLALFFIALLASAAHAEVMVHDPSVIKADGKYYIFGSHITAAKSDDLINWQVFTNGYEKENNALFGSLSENLSESFKWAGEDDMDCAGGFAVWAPDVYYDCDYVNPDGTSGAYLMYYSASSTYIRSCIGLAASKNVEGPYEYVSTILYSGFTQNDAYDFNDSAQSRVNKSYKNTNIASLIESGDIEGFSSNWGTGETYNSAYAPNCIDPCVYEGRGGSLYLAYGSWSGGIFSIELDRKTGLAKYPGKDSVTSGGNRVDRYFGTKIAGGNALSGEGPFVLYDSETDYFYLFDTYEWLGEDGGYHIRLFRSKNPDGPFVDSMGRNAVYSSSDLAYQGVKLFGNYRFGDMDAAYKSGGHCSYLIDDDGSRYLVYHTRFSDRGGYFETRVHRVYMNRDGWLCVSPYTYKGSESGVFSKSDVSGSYQFINHGTAIGLGASYETPRTIKLTVGGNVRGAESGTWEMEGNNITLRLTSGTYNGVLLRCKNEKDETVTAFTATGDNNSCVWGVK